MREDLSEIVALRRCIQRRNSQVALILALVLISLSACLMPQTSRAHVGNQTHMQPGHSEHQIGRFFERNSEHIHEPLLSVRSLTSRTLRGGGLTGKPVTDSLRGDSLIGRERTGRVLAYRGGAAGVANSSSADARGRGTTKMSSRKGRVRVYIACSLDGFISGPNNELDWLSDAAEQKAPESKDTVSTNDLPAKKDEGQKIDAEDNNSEGIGFEEFLNDVGCLLMGRNTYDVVSGFGPDMWAYGNRPVHVVTHRQISSSKYNVSSVSGDIPQLVSDALKAAGGKDVYVDGGNLIRQVLDAGLLDDIIITMVPRILGQGKSLFSGALKQHPLEFVGHYSYQNSVQIHARPKDHKC